MFAIPLFAGAGRLEFSAAWQYLGVWGAAVIAGTILSDPDLARERMRPGGKSINLGYYALSLLFVGHLLVAGMDAGRYHWTVIPERVRLAALALLGASLAVLVWAVHVNRFFSSVVRIQTERGHTLVSEGPYRFVRHPGNAAGLTACLASGIALGSWWAEIFAAPFVPFILYRTMTEDAFLKQNLPGYEAYAARVRHRLLPGVW